MTKGIILAGGKGTRLQPATFAMNKHMVPVLNKPMVLYPIETMKSLGVTNILLISGGNHLGHFTDFLGDGSDFGVDLTYKVQKEAGGIAQALGLAEGFANGDQVAVILGDNVFENKGITNEFSDDKAYIYLKMVDDANRFGVWLDDQIIEKPDIMGPGLAVTGLYVYPASVFDVIKTLKPSKRGELEVTDLNNHFIKTKQMEVRNIRGFWSDAGTPASLAAVTNWANQHYHG